MEAEIVPPWQPHPDQPQDLAAAFLSRDHGALALCLAQDPAAASEPRFICRASHTRYPDPGNTLLFVPGDIARVAMELRWWDGLRVVCQSGYGFFDQEGAAPCAWLALLHGDVDVVSAIMQGRQEPDFAIHDACLLAMAGAQRNDLRRQAVQAVVEHFGPRMDPWKPIASQPTPPTMHGIQVCTATQTQSGRVRAAVRADPDLISKELSCIHVLLSENLPHAAAALVHLHRLPSSIDQRLLATHWFSGATRHAGADPGPSTQAMVALIEAGLAVPSISHLIDRSVSLEDFGQENFDRLMLVLVERLVGMGAWQPCDVPALRDMPAIVARRQPRWLDVLEAMRSASALEHNTSHASADQSEASATRL